VRLVAEVAFGLRGTKEHPVLRHAQSVDCQKRLALRQMCHGFRRESKGINQRARQPKSGGTAAAHDRDLAKKLREQHILAAENIMFAGRAKPQGGEMPACNIVDMHEIEPGVDKTRYAAGCRLDDDPACRRRFLVARPNRRRRMHDDGRQMIAADHCFDDPLGGNLALFIGPNCTGFTNSHRFVGLSAIRRTGDGRHAARVDDALHSRRQCLLHEKPCPLPVVPQNLFRITSPEPVIGGDMEQITGARHGARDGGRVAHVAFYDLNVEAREIHPLAGFPQQSADMIAGPDQRARHGGTNEARSSRDQNLVTRHSARPPLEPLQPKSA
jgi:hypothetical protein